VGEQIDHRRGNGFRRLARDDSSCVGIGQGFGSTARGAGQNRLTTRLGLQEHDAESLEVPADLTVWKREQVALLVVLDQVLVAGNSPKLDRFLEAEFADKAFEVFFLPALPCNSIKDLGIAAP